METGRIYCLSAMEVDVTTVGLGKNAEWTPDDTSCRFNQVVVILNCLILVLARASSDKRSNKQWPYLRINWPRTKAQAFPVTGGGIRADHSSPRMS